MTGGNTTIIPFAVEPCGHSQRGSVVEYHEEADGKCHINYGFHLIINDPTPSALGQELSPLVRDGYTSFKVFKTYGSLL